MKKFSEIFVHVGVPKTGSSSIQAFCAENKERLIESEVLYPGSSWHAQLGSYLSGQPLNFIFNVYRSAAISMPSGARIRNIF